MNYDDFVVPASHPCLPGHFPDNPIVPGVVVLERVTEAVMARTGAALAGIKRGKFVRPLRPEQLCTVSWIRQGDDLRFECHSSDGLVASGVLQVIDG